MDSAVLVADKHGRVDMQEVARVMTPPGCPNCAKLTYGPLTEEMVAEALEDVDMTADDFAGYRQMARFVLRLLIQLYPLKTGQVLNGYYPDGRFFHGTDWKKILLGLARKSP